ncbi:hypothetical protein GAN17_10065 [Mycobacterium kubicae]|uniref:hypothetical protein n=1 Tax=Mycobacterium kubicae TaxID=120959 RepID=UPI001640BA72|nr:hypothetical protein [Mycobacterium kubicae]QNI06599.1 hypothetical protein GAN17_10065 [Mycobacterium kubicae]
MAGGALGVDRFRFTGPHPQHRSLPVAEDLDIGWHSGGDALRGGGEQDHGEERADDEERRAQGVMESASLVCLHAKYLVPLLFQEQQYTAFCRWVLVLFEHEFEYAGGDRRRL